jgi:predicted ATPase
MKIKFTGKYKSLTSFESEELSDFTLITGKNGTGKSQLIFCIDNSIQNSRNQVKTYELKFEPDLQRIQVSDLIYKTPGPVTTNTIKTKLEEYYTAFTNIKSKHKFLYNILLHKSIHLKDFINLDLSQIDSILKSNVTELKRFLVEILTERAIGGFAGMNEGVILQRLKVSLSSDIDLFDILFTIKNYQKKNLDDFDRNDFFKTPIPEKYIDSSDMFKSQVETIFLSYLKRRSENDYLNYRNEKFDEKNNVISDTEFGNRYPAPWDLINKILAENNIPLKVRTYHITDFSNDMIVEVKLSKNGVSELVSFADLSSGEQVIIGLIIKLFTDKYYETDLKFPQLIILDEPDASLHPEMSKLLIDVLYKSFVLDLGIKIIMTTHSPATVALTPEESIYEMSNTPNCSLKKISKDYALELLTGMIPTLSIDYKNHKQILLESPTDVKYFQNLFNKLNSEEKLNYKLYFISNEMGKSNSDWVVNTVQKLREGGVSRAYGIIDWDGKNRSSVEVLVHGETKRYSIENYLCDAVYLTILFLETKIDHGIRLELGFDHTYNQYHLVNESNDRLQKIWDWFIEKIQIKFPTLKSESTRDFVYYNDKKISVPEWFATTKGHELEEKIKETFLALKSKYTSEGQLQSELSIIMTKCYPLVPVESVALLKNLCI